MRFLVKVTIPMETGNASVKDPGFAKKMAEMLAGMKPEAAYFAADGGFRGGFFVVDLSDASQLPAIAEPWFLWLKARVEFEPVMRPEDLAQAGPAIAAAVKAWG